MACTICQQSAARGGLLPNLPNMSYLVSLSYFGPMDYAPFMNGRYVFQGQSPIEVESSHAAQMLGYVNPSPTLLAGDPLREQHLFQLATVEDFERMLADGFLAPGSKAEEFVAPTEPASREVKTPAPDAPKASAAAQKLAEENGIDLAGVTGTGADGAITVNDVKAAIAAARA